MQLQELHNDMLQWFSSPDKLCKGVMYEDQKGLMCKSSQAYRCCLMGGILKMGRENKYEQSTLTRYTNILGSKTGDKLVLFNDEHEFKDIREMLESVTEEDMKREEEKYKGML